jgi:hypothetical protein
VTTTSCNVPASAPATGGLAVASGCAAVAIPAVTNPHEINAVQILRIMVEPPFFYDVSFSLLNGR